MFRYAQCPVCHSKLKFKGERSSLVCPKCKTKIALTTEALPQGNSGHPKTSSAQLPSHPPAAGTKSQGLVIGIAAGTIVATLVTAVILFLPERKVLQASLPRENKQPPSATPITPTANEVAPSETQTETSQNQNNEKPQLEDPSEPQHETNTAHPPDNEAKHNVSEQPEKSASEKPSPHEQSAAVKGSWQYEWQTGDKFSYQFQLDSDQGGTKETAKGTCYYKIGAVANEPSEEELAATGTGFVISADGYLVTCAHVVHQAASVKVTLGKQSWNGKVVAIDQAQDLALLKINAKSLPVLAISTAKDVVLAETVRVAGFPLSNMLGKGIKITSGSVAGRAEENEEGARSFQVDASVNPGNSGGPVIDENGQVVGVASALLSGFRISEVGFAVPAREVRRLLQKSGIKTAEPENLKPRTGPEIAKMVIPSVAYLEVQIDPKYQRSHWIEYEFSYQTRVTSKPPGSPRGRSLASRHLFPSDGKGKFAITRFGEISRIEGNHHLPFILDPLGTLVIENLQHEGKKQWSASSITELKLELPVTRFEQMQRLHLQGEERLTSLMAVERTGYKILENTTDQVTFSKEYTCQTLGDKTPPTYRQKGTGTVVFDKKIGMTKNIEFQSSVQLQNGEVAGPLTTYKLSYKLTSAGATTGDRVKAALGSLARLVGAGVAKDTEKNSPKLGSPKPNQKISRPANKPNRRKDPQRVNELLALLDPKNTSENQSNFEPDLSGFPAEHVEQFRKHAERIRRLHRPSHTTELSELANLAVVTKRQQKVGEIFLHYAANGDSFDQRAAIRGLTNWATKKHVPEMILLLTSEDEEIRWPERKEIITTLSRFKSPQVCRAIASRLMHFTEEDEASEALIAIGPAAEKAVAKILDHKSEGARGAAAEILKVIGTRKSLAALKKALQEEPDVFAKDSIKEAIEAIQSR